jgi:hypothetical protein
MQTPPDDLDARALGEAAPGKGVEARGRRMGGSDRVHAGAQRPGSRLIPPVTGAAPAATDAIAPAHPPAPRLDRKAVGAVVLGNALEFYDFTVASEAGKNASPIALAKKA